MNKDILNKVDEIIALIKNSDNYQKYLSLKECMENNKELKELINEIKTLQKEIVHGKNEEELLNTKLKELNDSPLYREYNNTLVEINNTFSIIENTINNYFTNKLN